MAESAAARRASVAEFSTRFLASDGIPTYNALLDTHLGKRRAFLLGNKRSLAHLQRTGAIAHVEPKPSNPSQYVVYMNDPKPTIASSGSASVGSTMRRAPTLSNELINRSGSRPPILKSESTPQLALASQKHARRRRRRVRRDSDERDDDDDDDGSSSDEKPPLSRSVSATTLHDAAKLSQPQPSPSTVIDRLRRRRTATASHDKSELASKSAGERDGATVVERLLASDAAFQLKIQVLRDEMQVLEKEKLYFDRQIATMRKRLRGVHAVHENDVAVAHCAAIMHARIVKGEEEYMKLVTAQQQVMADIDTLRRELLTMRKVTKKLTDDIADVETTNAAITEKVRAAKSVRNVLSQELVELERRAEIEGEEQRLKLPPEEDVVVDAQELMSAVQQRQAHGGGGKNRALMHRPTVVLTTGSPLENLQRMLSEKAIGSHHDVTVNGKPLLSFRRAFRVIQQTLGLDTKDEQDDPLDRFVRQFGETEDALLSKHKLNAQLQDEVDQLEKEAAALAHDATQRRASLRSTQHTASAMQHQLQDKIQHTLERIDAVNALRDVRNVEQTRLRAIMQRCLEILHAEKLVSSQESLHGLLLLSELSSPAMLEALQKKMTEVAITLKLEHNAKAVLDDVVEIKSTPSDRHASVVSSRNGRASGTVVRRSNLLLRREAGTSKIVLGPREPSGAALTAILMTAQPPTVDGAQVLSETHAAGMHALHPTIIPHATPSALSTSKRKLTITRASSIRAGKHVSVLQQSASFRRISAPASVATTSKRMLLSGSASSNSLRLQADDANARVIEHPDDLDS